MESREIFEAVRRLTQDASASVADGSVVTDGGVTYAFVEAAAGAGLFVSGKKGAARGFTVAQETAAGGAVGTAALCPLTAANAAELRKRLPFTAPSPVGKLKVTMGLGDRLGLAGRGHIRAVRPYKVSPVLAQQSVRELTLTRR